VTTKAKPRAASAQAVQAALDAAGVACQVVELPASTRSAREAAAAIGCEPAQIAKSIVFRGATSGAAYLVIARGSELIAEAAVAREVGEAVSVASPDFVRQATGFAIGGVPPVGHARPLATLIDEGLLAVGTLWAAAGTPNAVFRLTPEELQRLAGSRVVAVC
jgi:prolyl-tRNA editing enzyme YbaK/EbsC (Cys-tRNA(Pro) deacylase)